MSQLHVAPENDSKDHVVSLDEACWCIPQVQDEEGCKVMIHQPIDPLVSGSRMNIQKILLLDKDEKSCYLGTVDKVLRKQPPFIAPPEFAKGHVHDP